MEMREKSLSLSLQLVPSERDGGGIHPLHLSGYYDECATERGNSKTRSKPALSKCLTYYSFTQLFPLKPPAADAAGSR